MVKNCPMRHENGNCLPAGGFCTANKNICEALLNAYGMGKAQLSQEGTTISTCSVACSTQDDTISREDALLCLTGIISDMTIKDYIVMVSKRIRNLPPAQPEAPCYLGSPCEYQNPNAEIQEERTKKRTETRACDSIGRQVARLITGIKVLAIN